MTKRMCIPFAALAMLIAGCSGSSTLSDIERFPNPTFTARLVTSDSLELTIDNRASPGVFLMSTCEIRRERLEDGVWKDAPPSPNDPLVQCGQSGGDIFPAGEVTTFRRLYVAIGSDGALERVRTTAVLREPGEFGIIKSLASDGVSFFSEPFPGGIKE